MGIAENIESIRKRIEGAAKGRNVVLMAVTKKASIRQIRESIGCGINVIGESRVDVAIDKFFRLPVVEKHMIGHLQCNKAKLAVQHFDVIQSVDSLKLAKEIDKRAKGLDKVMPVMIEVNVSGEDQKYGISPLETEHFYDKLLKLTNIKVTGLMAMAPYVAPKETRPYFIKMKRLNDVLKLPHLSMGMSNDFEVAVEEGSTMVRIGTAIFG